MDCRWQEWPKFNEKQKDTHPNYCLYDQVELDMKRADKVFHCNIMGSNVKRAKNELQEKASSSAS
eukprot:2312234-Prorocentrum_lima.AAC.1